MSTPRLTVAEVCRKHGAEFLAAYSARLPAYKKKALWGISRCRSAELGTMVVECQQCGHRVLHYTSCYQRGCPQCEGAKEAQWLQARESELLPTHYFHVVFTLPHEFNELLLHNQQVGFSLFFKAVAKTLSKVMRSRLDAQVGFFALLHTWGQKLDFHPHIHCVVPGGGVKDDGSWVATSKKRRYFAPTKVLGLVFRGVFIASLKKAARQGKLHFEGNLETLFNQVVKKPWLVHAQPPFGSALQVLKYLSRYTRKVAIANSRLVSLKEGKVTFSFKDYAQESQTRLCTMTALEFIRRFLLHIPRPGFVRIRHYGFLAGKDRAKRIAALKETIAGLLPVLPLTTSAALKPCAGAGICPACHAAALTIIQKFPGSKSLHSITIRSDSS